MSRKEAIERSIKVWTYLSQNPIKNKEIAYDNLGLQHEDYFCPLCVDGVKEAQKHNSNDRCKYCAVWSGNKTCPDWKSSYQEWRRADVEERCAAAKVVLDDIIRAKNRRAYSVVAAWSIVLLTSIGFLAWAAIM